MGHIVIAKPYCIQNIHMFSGWRPETINLLSVYNLKQICQMPNCAANLLYISSEKQRMSVCCPSERLGGFFQRVLTRDTLTFDQEPQLSISNIISDSVPTVNDKRRISFYNLSIVDKWQRPCQDVGGEVEDRHPYSRHGRAAILFSFNSLGLYFDLLCSATVLHHQSF